MGQQTACLNANGFLDSRSLVFDETGKYSVGVGLGHPVTMVKTSLIGWSNRCV